MEPASASLSREDFRSDEAWNKYVAQQIKFEDRRLHDGRKIKTLQQKNRRYSSKLASLKDVITELRENEDNDAADFLKVYTVTTFF